MKKRVIKKLVPVVVSAMCAIATISPSETVFAASNHENYSSLTSISNYTDDESEFVINNAEDMKEFAKLVNSKKVSFAGKTIYLGNDINLGCDEDNIWSPIGTSATKFEGTFDGNNYTISGLYISKASTENQGFFGFINNATIKDLTVSGDIDCTKFLDRNGFAGIAATVYGNTTISGCTNNVNLTIGTATNANDLSATGGIVGNICGKANVTITDCTNNGKITGNSKAGYIGGIVGRSINSACVTITNCVNNSDISGYDRMGGIIGSVQNVTDITINSCVNNGDLDCRLYCAAGIAACIEGSNTTIINTKNTGDIICPEQYLGGIAGQVYSNGTLTIDNCHNEGDVTVTGKSGDSVGSAGGILGINEGASTTIKNTKNFGNVTGLSSGGYGGLVGSSTYTAKYDGRLGITDCFTQGVVSAPGYNGSRLCRYGVGGAIGSIVVDYAENIKIDNVTVHAIVNANGYAGGFVGTAYPYMSLATGDGAPIVLNNIDVTAIVSGVDVKAEGVAQSDDSYYFGMLEDRYTIKAIAGVSVGNVEINDSAINVVLTETLDDGSIYEINYDDSYRKEIDSVVRENKVYGVSDDQSYGISEKTDINLQAIAGTYNKYQDNPTYAESFTFDVTLNNVDVIKATTLRADKDSTLNDTVLPEIFGWDNGENTISLNDNFCSSASFGSIGVNIVLIERPELPDTEEEDVTPDTPFADPEEEEDVTPDIPFADPEEEEDITPDIPFADPEEEEDVTPDIPFADPENETEDIPEEDITVDIPFASPVTGDATNIVILICLSVVAAIAAGFVTLTKKNTKNN